MRSGQLAQLPDHRQLGVGLSAPSPEIEVIYDGACPACRSAVRRLRPGVALTDARTAPDHVAALSARGLDVDEGIVVRTGESYLSGAEAARYLARLHVSAGRLERLAAWCFGSPRRAALAYPLFRALRRVLLFVLRRPPISAGRGGGRR
jgi:predicted DCC family thiol-disulfide oxidoreductase YuxK